MKKKPCIAAIALLLLAALVLFLSNGFFYALGRTFVPYTGGPDLYSAAKAELAQLDKCGYSGTFGPVTSGKAAADAAAQVISEIYGHSERPYLVKFNETADAWIVQGSKGFLSLGGVAVAAIDRTTGEVIMLFHTKLVSIPRGRPGAFSVIVLLKLLLLDIPVNVFSFLMTKHAKSGGVTWRWTKGN